MDELLSILQETQHPAQERRQRAEDYIHEAVVNDEFIGSLLAVAAAEKCPFHLRQLSLVLVIQQVRRRYGDMDADLHSQLMQFSFDIMASSENNLKNSGVVLLACIFLNGPQEEREHVTQQLFAVFSSQDLGNIYLASRCLCEILEEATFQSQVDILLGCHASLRLIATGVDRSQVHIVRNIAKVYRIVAFRVCDARLANDFTSEGDERMMAVFSSCMADMVQWCAQGMAAADILESLGVRIEVAQLLAVVAESFPALCSQELELTGETSSAATTCNMLGAITHLAWGHLQALRDVQGEGESEFSGGHVAHDGDRIEVGVFVMHLFELLKVCINIAAQLQHSRAAAALQQSDLNGLIGMLVQFMQLSEEQVEQHLAEGNDFVAADQDDSMELSLRHTGCDFVHEMYMSSPDLVFEAIVSRVESDVVDFYAFLLAESEQGGAGEVQLGHGVLLQRAVLIEERRLVRLEASLFALRCMGRKFTKRFLRSQQGDAADPATQTLARAVQREVERLQLLLGGLVNTFFNDNFLALATSSPCERGSDSSKLSICRGVTSSLLFSFSQILPPASLRFLLTVLTQFSSAALAQVECIATRLYHCSALGALSSLAAKHFSYSDLVTDNVFELALQSLVDICTNSQDCTVHIPLENIAHLLSTAAQSLCACPDPSAPHFLSPLAVQQLVLLGLATWSSHRKDPFAVEIAQEMVLALLSALNIDGHCSAGQLGSAERLGLFCEVYFPRLEEIVADMRASESSKTLGDTALRSLVQSMSTQPCNSAISAAPAAVGGGEGSTIISVLAGPTLQAVCRVCDLSLQSYSQDAAADDGLRLDIGETLRSLSLLLSSRGLDVSCLEAGLRAQVVSAMLQAARQVLSVAEEFNYSAVCGSLGLLLVHFSGDMSAEDQATVRAVLQHVVQLIHAAPRSDNNRNLLTMGVVHIFCRDPGLVTSSLGCLSLPGGGNGMSFMIDVWFELHTRLESRYNRHVSALGMLHVLELYLQQGVGEAFLRRLLQLVVQAVGGPGDDDAEEDYEMSAMSLRAFSMGFDDDDDEDDDYCVHGDRDDEYNDEDDEDEDEDEDDEEGGGGDDDNPFAPAEMYLSDMLDGGVSGGRAHIYVPDSLLYSSAKLDPLYACSLQARLAEVAARYNEPQGFLMSCVQGMDDSTRGALLALL